MTFREFLEIKLTKEELTKFLSNIEQIEDSNKALLEQKYRKGYEAVAMFFDWDKSKEGIKYWCDINENLRNEYSRKSRSGSKP